MGMTDIHGKEAKWHTSTCCKVKSNCLFIHLNQVAISSFEITNWAIILPPKRRSYIFSKLPWPADTEKCGVGESRAYVHWVGITAKEGSRMTGWQMVGILNQASWYIAWMAAVFKGNNSLISSQCADLSFIYTSACVPTAKQLHEDI